MVACFGVSHRTASLALRERLAFGPESQRRWYEHVRDEWPGDEVPEVLLLSTCNRTECLVGGVVELEPARDHLVLVLTGERGVPAQEMAPALELFTGRDAMRHLGRVAAGVESMVFGESQILGQIRESLDRARAAGAAGPVLTALVEHALRAGRRVRRETAVGRCSASVASEALHAAGEQVDLAASRAVVLGAGPRRSRSSRVARARPKTSPAPWAPRPEPGTTCPSRSAAPTSCSARPPRPAR
jgi:glutamyl-tRNA reductase